MKSFKQYYEDLFKYEEAPEGVDIEPTSDPKNPNLVPDMKIYVSATGETEGQLDGKNTVLKIPFEKNFAITDGEFTKVFMNNIKRTLMGLLTQNKLGFIDDKEEAKNKITNAKLSNAVTAVFNKIAQAGQKAGKTIRISDIAIPEVEFVLHSNDFTIDFNPAAGSASKILQKFSK